MSQQPEALRLAKELDRWVDEFSGKAADLLRNQHAEIERLRAELEALHKQEPVANIDIWHNHGLENTNVDYWGSLPKGSHMLYNAAGAQPATPSTQITPNWIWSWLMDWCKRRGVPPSNYDSLFQMASDALLLAAGGPPAPSVPGRATMIERLKAAVEGECDGLAVDDRHAEAILDYVLAAAPEAPKSRPLTDAMVEAAGRALSDRHANGCGCGMDKDTLWSSYSDEFKEQARVALGAAHGIGDEA